MSTSKLQIITGNMLDKNFPQYRVRENFRPDWFRSSEGGKMELDFYIEEIRIAIEVQGEQHSSFVPRFHKTHDDFKRQLARDREKKDLCDEMGIDLFEVFTETDAIIVVSKIKERIGEAKDIPPDVVYAELENKRIDRRQAKRRRNEKKSKNKRLGIMVGELSDKNKAAINELNFWRKLAIRKMWKGESMSFPFESNNITDDAYSSIYKNLPFCTTEYEIINLFGYQEHSILKQ